MAVWRPTDGTICPCGTLLVFRATGQRTTCWWLKQQKAAQSRARALPATPLGPLLLLRLPGRQASWAPGCITQPRPPSSHGLLLLRLLGRQAPLGPRLHHPTQASVLTWRPPPCLFPPCVLHQDMRGFRAHAGRLGCPPVEPLSMPAETTICAVPWDGR